MSSVPEATWAVIEPLLAPSGLEIADVELVGEGHGKTLRVYVDRPGGVDLDAIAQATRIISIALDAADPITGRYTLEVSSPGLERRLRRPAEFVRFIGTPISVKTAIPLDGARRFRGTLLSADEQGIVLETQGAHRRIEFEEINEARTIFEWGPKAKPGSKPGSRTKVASR